MPMYSNQIASHHTRTSLELSPIMQETVFQKKQTLYTFADKLQSAVVGLGPIDPRNRRGISLVDRFEHSAWETPRVIVGDRSSASEEQDLRIIASMSGPP